MGMRPYNITAHLSNGDTVETKVSAGSEAKARQMVEKKVWAKYKCRVDKMTIDVVDEALTLPENDI